MQFIGSEIHDSISQNLLLASIYSQRIESQKVHLELSGNIQDISKLITTSIDEIRALSKTLMTVKNVDLSLTELLRSECDKIKCANICNVVMISEFEGDVGATVKLSLLRIIQEFMHNSLKHSNCTQITLKLRNVRDGLAMDVCDNGSGFLINEPFINDGIGLLSMKRRAAAIGASFSIVSEISRGTKIEMFLDHLDFAFFDS